MRSVRRVGGLAILLAALPSLGAVPVVRTVAPQSTADANTRLIQDAINTCGDAGGGRVDVTAGRYAVKPLVLRSGVELHLDAGAKLVFSRDFADYELIQIDDGSGPEPGTRPPIYGQNLTNIAITGQGTLDGQGDAWRAVQKRKVSAALWDWLVRSGGVTDDRGETWFPDPVIRDGRSELDKLRQADAPLAGYASVRPLLRPNLIRLVECRGVRIEGVTLRNSAMWNVHLALCDDVAVKGVTVFNDPWAINGDGIDLDSCRRVTLTESTVNAGDDAICLKSGKDASGRARARPTEDVTIERCRVGTGHGGVVIGSETSGGVRRVRVRDCTFDGTDNGLRFKSTRGRGGVVEDVDVQNVRMSKIGGVAVLFDLFYAANGKPGPATTRPDVTTPEFRDFRIRQVSCDGAKLALQIRGLPEMPLHNIELDDVTLTADRAGVVSDVDGVTFHNVHVTADDEVTVKNVTRPDVSNCTGFQPASKTLVVAADGSGDFKTLADALAAVPDHSAERTVLHLKAGHYPGQIVVPKGKDNVTFEGDGVDQTILEYAYNQNEPNPPGTAKNNPGVGVVVDADGFVARGLTFVNTSGDHGQAIALRITGDRAVVQDCRLLGWQDTLRLDAGRSYFYHDSVAGRVDFIYGSGTAVFDGCEIHSRNGGHVTAASTPAEKPYGFVFLDCKLTGDSVPYDFAATNPATTQKSRVTPVADLGRPWRPYAAVIFAHCDLGPHIRREGWSKWQGNANDKTCRYAEYKNTGGGAAVEGRAAFARQLSDDEAAKLTIANILGGSDHWNPKSALATTRPSE